MQSRTEASCVSWKCLVKVIVCGIFCLIIVLLLFHGSKSGDYRLCANEQTRHLCRIRNPSKNDFLRHVFDRLDHRVESRLQQRCWDRNTTRLLRYLAHDYSSGKGLGNYMFMVASTLGLAVSSGRAPIIDDPYDHLKIFQNTFPKRKSTQNPKDAVRFTDVPSCGKYDATLTSRISSDTSLSVLLTGYLQSWKFFNDERSSIRCQFTFAQHVYKSASEGLKSKLRQYPQNVLDSSRLIGIHVRRGDITAQDQNVQGHVPASDQYLLDSCAALDALYKSQTIFVVVSNDLIYCQTLFAQRSNFLFMDGNSAAVDLAILSLMDDLILTVGTYGWWGAFLSDAATVRYYKLWPRPGSAVAGEYNVRDFFLPHWIGAQ